MTVRIVEDDRTAKPRTSTGHFACRPDPYLLIALVSSWLVLMSLLYFSWGNEPLGLWLLCSFFLFVGLRDIWYFVFVLLRRDGTGVSVGEDPPPPRVAVLYPTCDDLCEEAVHSCVNLKYASFHVYILDDSSDPESVRRVDDIGKRYGDRITIVRRPTKTGFKAGNLNYALRGPASREEVFAIVDADEILPVDFLSRTVSLLLRSPRCGFVQANHRAKYWDANRFQRELGPGVDIHWRWYQPVRNRHGFVMLLGHGAVIRRSCWNEIHGFPEVVSEDLAFAVLAREHGWRGYFAEDVVCYEEFPRSLRAFRIRHMKWVRGNCEFLLRFGRRLLFSKNISVAEKVDILVPMLGANLFTLAVALAVGWSLTADRMGGTQRMLSGIDSPWRSGLMPVGALCMMVAFCGPILCFLVEYWRRPRLLLRHLALSALAYGGIGALTSVGVIGYMTTRQARFLVTGAEKNTVGGGDAAAGRGVWGWLRNTHPDSRSTLVGELAIGGCFCVAGCHLGGAILGAFGVSVVLQALLHKVEWRQTTLGGLVYAPFVLLCFGVVAGLVRIACPEGVSMYQLSAVWSWLAHR